MVPCVPRPHMGGAFILIRHLGALALFTATPSFSVHASSKAQCESARKKAVSACNQSMKDAAAASDANAIAAAKQVGSSKIKQSGQALASTGQFNNSVLDKAIGECEKARSACNRDCDESKAVNKQEAPDIAKGKKQCGEEIEKAKEQANAGKQGGNEATDGGQKTADSSGGQGSGGSPGGGSPQSGGEQSQQSPDTKDDSKVTDQQGDGVKTQEPQQPLAAAAPQSPTVSPDCMSPQAYLDDRCVNSLVDACSQPKQRSSGLCRSFQVHYCTKGSQGEVGSNGIKAGAGMGNEFCQGQLASQFCNDSRYPNRANCPSCLKERGLPQPSESPDPETCGTDPMYSVPANIARGGQGGVSGGSAGGGGGTGSGGGGGGGASGGGAKLVPEAVKVNLSEGSKDGLNMDSGGGGGGGSALSSALGSALEAGKRIFGGGRSPLSLTYDAGVTRDVEKSRTVNVFSIHEEVYRNRCANGKFLRSCGSSRERSR